jgi:hypothetical protein
MNVIVADDDDRTPDIMVRAMRPLWPKVRLLDTDGWVDRNAVIAAGAVTKLKKPRLLMPPRRAGPNWQSNWLFWTGDRYGEPQETLLHPVRPSHQRRAGSRVSGR